MGAMAALTPSRAGLWLGLAYAAAITVFTFSGADDTVVLLMDFILVPLIIGPAGVSALGISASASTSGKWAFFLCEAGIIASTAAGWTCLTVIAPDAQNGFAMLALTLFQYVAVLLFFVAASALGWRPAPMSGGVRTRRRRVDRGEVIS